MVTRDLCHSYRQSNVETPRQIVQYVVIYVDSYDSWVPLCEFLHNKTIYDYSCGRYHILGPQVSCSVTKEELASIRALPYVLDIKEPVIDMAFENDFFSKELERLKGWRPKNGAHKKIIDELVVKVTAYLTDLNSDNLLCGLATYVTSDTLMKQIGQCIKSDD